MLAWAVLEGVGVLVFDRVRGNKAEGFCNR